MGAFFAGYALATAVNLLVDFGMYLYFARKAKRAERNLLKSFCKLTCSGGSERGECPCLRPTDCQMTWSSQFPAWHREWIQGLKE